MTEPTVTDLRTQAEIDAIVRKLESETQLIDVQIQKARYETRISESMAEGARIAAERERLKHLSDGVDDSANRVFRYAGQIEERGLHTIMRYIDEWMRLDAESDNPDDRNRPYIVQFSSQGGEIISGLAMYDYLRSVNAVHPLTTVAIGLCASMTTVVMQAGQTRLSYPSTSWLVHRASWGAVGREDAIEDATEHVKLLQDRIFEILAERSNRSIAQLRAKSARRDWWFLGRDAEELGLVDGIV